MLEVEGSSTKDLVSECIYGFQERRDHAIRHNVSEYSGKKGTRGSVSKISGFARQDHGFKSD